MAVLSVGRPVDERTGELSGDVDESDDSNHADHADHADQADDVEACQRPRRTSDHLPPTGRDHPA